MRQFIRFENGLTEIQIEIKQWSDYLLLVRLISFAPYEDDLETIVSIRKSEDNGNWSRGAKLVRIKKEDISGLDYYRVTDFGDWGNPRAFSNLNDALIYAIDHHLQNEYNRQLNAEIEKEVI